MIVSKSKQIAALLENGEVKKAIAVASRFFDKSDDTKLFKQAKSAIENPSFYIQIGKNPEHIISMATDRLKARFTNG